MTARGREQEPELGREQAQAQGQEQVPAREQGQALAQVPGPVPGREQVLAPAGLVPPAPGVSCHPVQPHSVQLACSPAGPVKPVPRPR
jgi:hypothetical protein